MFETEAARIAGILLGRPDVSPLLNLGSSTRAFRETDKPHIHARLFAPLAAAGVEVFHSDLKAGDGIDLTGDILDPAVRAGLTARGFRCVLSSNLLEHVRDRAAAIAACEAIAGPGGLILATVPSSYPYHADPIDTGYRPTPAQLAAAFTRSECLLAEEVAGQTYAEQLAATGIPVWRAAAATLLWLLRAPVRPKSARARLDRWRWYRRRYRVALVLVRVHSLTSAS
ncbi:MAG: methyltransferase type 11 [Pseudomonadota bacterium]